MPLLSFNPTKPGRWCDLAGVKPVGDLKRGDDFRHPKYRRETFLRFYQFHTKYKTHPGCVYFLLPMISMELGLDTEGKLWLAFINGNTQNPVTSYLIVKRFPDCRSLQTWKLAKWFNEHYGDLQFDMDRRYQKAKFIDAVECYRGMVGISQSGFYSKLLGDYKRLYKAVSGMRHFGRLSTWSYTEYLSISTNGYTPEPRDLMLRDREGSRSHRNGLAKVLGRDDLDWHKSTSFNGDYSPEVMTWLESEAQQLLEDAHEWGIDASFFTLESALCTYKSWHRPNRRYPNVYADMLKDRITWAEERWGDEVGVFWDMRRDALPKYLRCESLGGDPGLSRVKQNHYRETGCPVMMGQEWGCFGNPFDDALGAELGAQ